MSDIKNAVRDTYARIAVAGTSEAGCCAPSCCSVQPAASSAEEASKRLGYTAADVTEVPEGSNLGLGCGNPQVIAALKPGETVLDLGSGAGFDCFLAAKQVGSAGKVIGVDMTPEMLTRARENATKTGTNNVEFRLGEIERLPVADRSVDVIISNCVINLSPDKAAVYGEAFRVLKPGGRVAISDVVSTAPLPDDIRDDVAMLTGCVAGASTIGDLASILAEAGFEDIQIRPLYESRFVISEWRPGSSLGDYIMSATVEARRP